MPLLQLAQNKSYRANWRCQQSRRSEHVALAFSAFSLVSCSIFPIGIPLAFPLPVVSTLVLVPSKALVLVQSAVALVAAILAPLLRLPCASVPGGLR